MSIGKCVQLCFFVMCAPLDDRFSYFCMCLGEITLRLVRFALFLSRKINTHLTHTHTHSRTGLLFPSIIHSNTFYVALLFRNLLLKICITHICTQSLKYFIATPARIYTNISNFIHTSNFSLENRKHTSFFL